MRRILVLAGVMSLVLASSGMARNHTPYKPPPLWSLPLTMPLPAMAPPAPADEPRESELPARVAPPAPADEPSESELPARVAPPAKTVNPAMPDLTAFVEGMSEDEAKAARRMVKTFFDVSEKVYADHVDPIPVGKMEFSSLSALSDLDPALSVRQTGADLALSANGRTIHRVSIPADLTRQAALQIWVGMLAEARAASPGVREAAWTELGTRLLTAGLDSLGTRSGFVEFKRGGVGVGLDVKIEDRQATVVRPIPNTPAARAGVLPGDRILTIDGQSMAGRSVNDVVNALTSDMDGSTVTVGVRRGDQDLTFPMKRERITVESLTAQFTDGILVAELRSLDQNAASRLRAKLSAAAADPSSPLRGIILDLRGSPGGLLEEAIALAGLFVDDGTLMSVVARRPEDKQIFRARLPGTRPWQTGNARLPVLVLTDSGTALGAELVAAALQFHGQAVVIGSGTQGKDGLVQTLIPMPGSHTLRLSTARLITPAGWMIDDVGISPTLCTAGLADPQSVLAQIDDGSAARARNATRGSDDDRRRLRKACPPVGGAKAATDLAVAERLVNDPALYARALGKEPPGESK